MHPVTFLVVVLAVTPFTTVTAQHSLSVRAGDRVRITVHDLQGSQHVANLEAVRGDHLIVTSRDSTASYLASSVGQLEVSRGRTWSVPGGILGFLGGAAVGMAVAWFAFQDDQGAPTCTSKLPPCAAFIAGFGIGGAVLGAYIGGGERREEVPLDRLCVSVGPQRDGRLGLGASVRF